MTWKSYALVSGATVLAGWIASTPPSNAPAGAASASRQPSNVRDSGASEIEREAARLQVRVRREVAYDQPHRNPFRFGSRTVDAEQGGDIPAAAPVAEPDVALPLTPPLPQLSLSGIAEDQQGQSVERTAILSSPSGVLLVHEGEPVLADYRVVRIESEAIELVRTDGTTLRLTLKP